MTKVAVIDMGTNTFHLLIAGIEGGTWSILHRDHEPVKIGLAGINEGFITDSACERATAAMKRFRKTIDASSVGTIMAFGTSALRNARNGEALVEQITSTTGIPIRIISGEEEADLIFQGVRAALELDEDNHLIMDIGAGSVECIIGNARQILWKKSFEIGGQRLLEKFQKHDPITSAEIAALDNYFEVSLQPLVDALESFDPRVLVGSSGTFDTLSDIFCIRNGMVLTERMPETPLSLHGFYEIYHDLLRKDRKARMETEGMIEMRVDMIIVACCLIRFVLEKHPFENIRVSTYSLKEGVLANLARQVNDEN